MVKRKKVNPIHARTGPYYKIGTVKGLVNEGKVVIRSQALESALNDFGWELVDILDAFKKLQRKHFYKTANSNFIPDLPIDYYKARDLKGEDIYTHFYIDKETQVLQVDSFKRI
jgi:hypothetical protein